MLKLKKKDIYFLSAYEMTKKILSQEITSQEITEAIIERIETINPEINAYCTPSFDIARDMAKKADLAVKKGEKFGLLHGIPISIKDDMQTKGIRTTSGSITLKNHVPRRDELIVKKFRDAGTVFLGKTNMPEFGFKAETDNIIFGVTKNPWNLKKTSGGSSGGAAAAVASGLGPLALGSDGGGSIRVPSCFCGVYGLKPTSGRIPLTAKKSNNSFGTLLHRGPIVRYVKDAALMMDVIVAKDDSDRYSLPKPNYRYIEKLKENPKKLKIGYSLDLGFANRVDEEVKSSVLNAVQKFDTFNWNVQEAKIKLKNAKSTIRIIWLTGWATVFKGILNKWKDKIDPYLVRTINDGLKYTKSDLEKAQIQREKIYLHICKLFKKFDILITPTVACPAFELGKSRIIENGELKTGIIINGEKVGVLEWCPFTSPFNLSGHPAASIPCGWSSDGLPIGMQIIGKFLDDLTVLQVSRVFEEIQPWHDKYPQFK